MCEIKTYKTDLDLAECKTTHMQHESKTRKEEQTVTAQLHMVQREVCSFVSYEEALYAELHVLLKARFKRSSITGPAVKLMGGQPPKPMVVLQKVYVYTISNLKCWTTLNSMDQVK